MINKKLSLLVSLILGVSLSLFVSCGDDDDKYDVKINEVWKNFNDSLFYVHEDSLVSRGGEYIKLPCLTGNGDVYYKRSSDIKPADLDRLKNEIRPKVNAEGNPQFTDSVDIRYMGWYYTKNTEGELKRITFDGTEIEGSGKASKGFQIKDLTRGFATMLQFVDIKDLNQVQVVIPYNLAYGESAKTDANGNVTIPGYTTLYFNILLEKIIPLNPDEYPNVDLGGLDK